MRWNFVDFFFYINSAQHITFSTTKTIAISQKKKKNHAKHRKEKNDVWKSETYCRVSQNIFSSFLFYFSQIMTQPRTQLSDLKKYFKFN